MKTPRIAIAGSANIDLTTFSDQLPRPGETIFGRAFHLGFGGKGANQAVAARLCGAEVAMIARVGDDLFGPATVRNLEAFGIDTTHVTITPGASSGVAPILVDSEGRNRIIVVKGANDLLSPDDIDRASDILTCSDMIVLQLDIYSRPCITRCASRDRAASRRFSIPRPRRPPMSRSISTRSRSPIT